jgi:hypothetical protein
MVTARLIALAVDLRVAVTRVFAGKGVGPLNLGRIGEKKKREEGRDFCLCFPWRMKERGPVQGKADDPVPR